ncbi:MAG: hypothetical protein HOW73_17065 [Polyangiaceae bacterium]|nr:hypothetical protein [Polyangiaceae bacterium]
MSKIGLRVAAVVAFGSFAALATSSVFAGGTVTETKPECALATAVLLVGNGGDSDAHWQKIRGFLESQRVWTIGSAKPGVAGEVELVQWDVVSPRTTGPQHAFSVRCGTGGTCNNVAQGFLKAYPEVQPAPVVFCGDQQAVLSNPTGR